MSLLTSSRVCRILLGFLFVVVLVGCAQAQPTPKPATEPAPAKAAPAPAPTKAVAAPTATAAPAPTKAAAPAPTVAAAPAQPKPAAAAPKSATVKVGHIGLVAGNAQLYIAMDKGYFKEQGIEVELIKATGSVEMLPHLTTGNLDVGLGSFAAGSFNAVGRKIPVKAVGTYAVLSTSGKMGYPAMGKGAGVATARKDLLDSGQLKDFKDLKGKNFAINSKPSLSGMFVDKFLQAGGLTWNDINLVEMPFPDMMAAFATKNIDVAYQTEPYITMTADRGFASIWKDQSEVQPDLELGAMLYGAKLDPEVGKRFMVGYLKGVRDYLDGFITKKMGSKEVDDLVTILIKYTAAKDRAQYAKIAYRGVNPDGYLYMPSIVEQYEWFDKQGLITDKASKADMDAFVDNQYVDYALQRIGKYKW